MLLILKITTKQEKKASDWLPKEHGQTEETKKPINTINVPQLQFCYVNNQYVLVDKNEIITLKDGQLFIVDDYEVTVSLEKEVNKAVSAESLPACFKLKSLNSIDSHAIKSLRSTNLPTLKPPRAINTTNGDELDFLYNSNLSTPNSKVESESKPLARDRNIIKEQLLPSNIQDTMIKSNNILKVLGFEE